MKDAFDGCEIPVRLMDPFRIGQSYVSHIKYAFDVTQQEEFADAADAFQTAATKLAEVAAMDEPAAYRAFLSGITRSLVEHLQYARELATESAAKRQCPDWPSACTCPPRPPHRNKPNEPTLDLESAAVQRRAEDAASLIAQPGERINSGIAFDLGRLRGELTLTLGRVDRDTHQYHLAAEALDHIERFTSNLDSQELQQLLFGVDTAFGEWTT